MPPLPVRALDWIRLRMLRPRRHLPFHVVTSAHEVAPWITRCLDSVASQRYPREAIIHHLIDDASGDETVRAVEGWVSARERRHEVRLTRNYVNRGGCANYRRGFRNVPRDGIIVQLDGDDWFADRWVLAHLNAVYSDPDVWVTYNSFIHVDGRRPRFIRPLPPEVVAANRLREYDWVTSAPHSFRASLFCHVRDEDLIDPTTGAHWRFAFDLACHMPLLELAGSHARHVDRVLYVYNQTDRSMSRRSRPQQRECERRIRRQRPYAPLPALTEPAGGSGEGFRPRCAAILDS